MTADITLRGPDEVIAVLPYQLGYHPRNSVVAVALRGRSMGMVARTDLPPEEHAVEAAASLVGPLMRDGATAVVVVAWEDAPDASTPVLLSLVEQLEEAGAEVVDVAVVRDGRRFSPICSEACCPADGEPLRDPTTVPAVADLVALGRAPLPSRDDVDRLVEPDGARDEGVARAIAARADRRPGRRRWARAWGRLLEPGAGSDPPDDVVVADAVLALADVGWRDGLIGWLSPGVLPSREVEPAVLALLRTSVPLWPTPARRAPVVRTDHPALLGRLLDVCRAVPDSCDGEAAAICTVAAHVAWADGEGAVARAALERALRLVPDYRLADLLVRLVDGGVRFPRGPGRPHGDAGLRSVG
ncbi:DUF4192 domain-containing protein [Oryzobacter telluris]|uniref:DUF4192 domain-containing protein n=1 Tax=Oryzobacter telluris TaxID=3149179 RepID=UPI00370D9794